MCNGKLNPLCKVQTTDKKTINGVIVFILVNNWENINIHAFKYIAVYISTLEYYMLIYKYILDISRHYNNA